MNIADTLESLRAAGNLRTLPPDTPEGTVDLSSNDYLGLADDIALRERFLDTHPPQSLWMTSSASRLLAGRQQPYAALERLLADSYGGGREALLFNSGYHANTGLVSALADSRTLIAADRLVHASIIDGVRLSGAHMERWRHGDYDHLERILERHAAQYTDVLIIAESVYSMDGDRADLRRLADIKRRTPGARLYIDEAHAAGVCGPAGLGVAAEEGVLADIDILVGTLGKALASSGAFAILEPQMRRFMVNRSRSLIFSTALPPACADWSALTWQASLDGDWRRERLAVLARMLAAAIPGGEPSHIRPLLVGDASRAVALSEHLLTLGFKALPIRTPTVPPGTERLRFSLSASLSPDDIHRLDLALKSLADDAI